jgi:E3 ubiquitin-protein ligase HERC1
MTSYPYCAPDHEIVQRFWRVFEEFSEEERQLYLKFVWGRTRIPIDISKLPYKHEIRLMENMDRTGFPQSRTCFFQLDIPFYENDEICRQRLAVASELCGGIDTD